LEALCCGVFCLAGLYPQTLVADAEISVNTRRIKKMGATFQGEGGSVSVERFSHSSAPMTQAFIDLALIKAVIASATGARQSSNKLLSIEGEGRGQPGGWPFSFACPKERGERKGHPATLTCGFPCQRTQAG
jgi:hypothetical protein